MAALGEPVVAPRVGGGHAWWGSPRTGWSGGTPPRSQWWLGPTLSPLLGRLRSFAVDEGGVWVAGERAIGFARYNAMPTRAYLRAR